jgi:hypothetical protein
MKFRKRKTTTMPAAVTNAGGTEALALQHSGKGNLGSMKLKHWKAYMRTLSGQANAKIKDIFRTTADDYDEEQGASSWLDSGNNVYLGASGNVGIGNSTPTEKLDVRSASVVAGEGARLGEAKIGTWANTAYAVFTNNSVKATDNSYAVLQKNDGTTLINTALSKRLHFRINNVDKMTINGDNVGINQYSPAYTLDVTGDINFTGTLRQNGSAYGGGSSVWTTVNTDEIHYSGGNVGIGTNNPVRTLHLYSGGTSTQLKITTSNTGHVAGDGIDLGIDANSHGFLFNRENKDLRFGTNTAERMRILAGGNVGIGTNNPGYLLHLHRAASASVILQLTNNTTGSGTSDGFKVQLGAQGDFHFIQQENADLAFHTNNSEKMRLLNSGNLGIGVGNPAYTLDVAGDINFTGSVRKNGVIQTFGGGGSSFSKITETIPGTYGSISTTGSGGSGNSNWEGYSINGRYVFMSQNDDGVGIYNDIDNKWIMYYQRDSATTGHLKFYVGGTEKMRIRDNGKVGIGTDNPLAHIHVVGKGIFHDGVAAAPQNASYGGTGCRLILWPGSGSETPYGFGIDNNTLWSSCPSSASHKWYVGTSIRAQLSSSLFNVTGDMTIGGNLIVNGTTTTVNVATLEVEDSMIKLATNNTTTTTDFGFYGRYGTTANYAGLVRQGAGHWELANFGTTEPTTTTATASSFAALTVGSLTTSGSITSGIISVTATAETSPAANGIYCYNPTNSANQHAIIAARVAGSSAGDPFFSVDVNGVTGWCFGMDNSDGDKFKISNSWDRLELQTKFTIDTSGNVGIGISNPTESLHIYRNGSSPTLKLDTESTSGNDPILIWAEQGATKGLFGYSTAGNYMYLQTGGTDRLRIRDTGIIDIIGNLGIGTINPTSKLHVVGNCEQTDSLMNFIRMQLPKSGDPQGGVHKGYIILGKADVTGSAIPASYAIGKIIMRRGTNVSGHNIDVYNVTSSRGWTDEVFHVNLEFDGTSGNALSRFSRLVKCTYGGVVYHAIETINSGGDPTTERIFEGYAMDAALVFVDATSVSSITAFGTIGMSIEGGGNVGIGTNSPLQKLDVRGNVGIGDMAQNINDIKLLIRETSSNPIIGLQNGGNSIIGLQVHNNNQLKIGNLSGSDLNALMVIGSNVGIGTTAPTAKLHVSGTSNPVISRISTSDNQIARLELCESLDGQHGGYIEYRGNDSDRVRIGVMNNYVDTVGITISENGNIGIGANTPSTKLHVYDGGDLLRVSRSGDSALLEIGYNGQGSNSVQTTTATIKFGSAAGDANYEHCVIENREHNAAEQRELLLYSGNDSNDRIRLNSNGGIYFDIQNSGTDRTIVNTKMLVHRNGNVTIGTTSGTMNAKLWVEGTGPNSANISYAYLNSGGTGPGNVGPYTVQYSMGSSGRHRASEFNATSDERKKKDFVEIADNTALDLVNQLKVYNFKWKGELEDTTLKTGVKAQEVEAIYPSCVTQVEGAIPSILEEVVYNNKKFNLTDVSGLTIGDKLKIFYQDKENNNEEKELQATIVNIIGNEVEIDQEIKDDDDKIYVYGKICNNVRTIDYNSLNMLSIGAIKSLVTKNNVLENKVATLETELAAIKAHLGL